MRSRSLHLGPTGGHDRGPDVVGRPVQAHLDPAPGEHLGQSLAPLDDGDGLVEVGVEIEVVELGGAVQAIGVDVHQGRATVERRMHPGDHEGR